MNLVFVDVTTPIALVASAEEKTNYLLIKTTVAEEADMPVAIQLYGELAEITGIGQGFGTKILVSDTNPEPWARQQSVKDSERITTTDGNGDDTGYDHRRLLQGLYDEHCGHCRGLGNVRSVRGPHY